MGAYVEARSRRGSITPFQVRLGVVAVAALVLRIVYVVAVRHHALGGDGLAYHYAALDLRHGKGFVDPLDKLLRPSAHHPPAWTLVLAIPPLIGLSSLLDHQLFAALIGTGTVVVAGLIGRRISSDRGGLIAATLAAAYPGLWLYERALLSETLLFLAVGILVIVAYRYLDEPSRRRAVALGGMCGVLALVRSEQLGLVIALLIPLIVRRRLGRQQVGSLVLAGLATVLAIAPWTLYNLSRLDDPVILSTGFGAAMAQGNCANAYSGPLLGYYDFPCLGTNVRKAAQRGAKYPYRDATLREQSITYMKGHVKRLPIVSVARQGRAWSFFRPLSTADLEAEFSKTPTWVHRAATFFYWALVPAAVVGGVALHRRRMALLPLVAPFVVTAIAVATTYGQPRLRAGAEVPLVLLAAIGIEHLLRTRRAEVDR